MLKRFIMTILFIPAIIIFCLAFGISILFSFLTYPIAFIVKGISLNDYCNDILEKMFIPFGYLMDLVNKIPE